MKTKWRAGLYEEVDRGSGTLALFEVYEFDDFTMLLEQCIQWRREGQVVRIRTGTKLPDTINSREDEKGV